MELAKALGEDVVNHTPASTVYHISPGLSRQKGMHYD